MLSWFESMTPILRNFFWQWSGRHWTETRSLPMQWNIVPTCSHQLLLNPFTAKASKSSGRLSGCLLLSVKLFLNGATVIFSLHYLYTLSTGGSTSWSCWSFFLCVHCFCFYLLLKTGNKEGPSVNSSKLVKTWYIVNIRNLRLNYNTAANFQH